MTITQQKRRSRSETFLSGAPDTKPATPKLRGKRRPMALSLPPDLVEAVDEIAAEESRSRAKMIEVVLREFVRERRRGQAA
jgi:hypothetical protein